MQTLLRNHSVISGAEDLIPLHSFKQFPIFMGCTDAPRENDLHEDMQWHISPSTGSIQLNPLIPLDILYMASHGAGSTGRLWDLHHEEFARFIAKYDPKAVIEIGGGHGILAIKYRDFRTNSWVILEPNPSPAEGCPAEYIRGFFDENFIFDEKFDAVVHSHVFEHIYEPQEFMRQLSNSMLPGKMLLFSIPNMQVMLENKYTNCINFEHSFLLTEPYVEHLLAENGFRLVDKQYFLHDHSIFFAAVRDSSTVGGALPSGLFEKNRELYLNYVSYHEELIRDINGKIREMANPVYLFGAHVFAQYLLAFGLDTSKIVSILDNDPKKQGKRLYGTDLMVRSPKTLKEDVQPVVILKAGVYNEEIKEDILKNINAGTLFIE